MNASAARHPVAAALAALGAAWPTLLCAVQDVIASPLERLVRDSICGGPPQAWPSHGWACWIGATAILAASALVLNQPARAAAPAEPSAPATSMALHGLVRVR